MREEPFDENEIALFERLKPMDAKKLAGKVPLWAKPVNPPKPFVFKPNQPPVFPAHVKPNAIREPTYSLRYCVNGPFAGSRLAICDEFDGFLRCTLPFTIGGVTGRYVLSDSKNAYSPLKWEPAPIPIDLTLPAAPASPDPSP